MANCFLSCGYCQWLDNPFIVNSFLPSSGLPVLYELGFSCLTLPEDIFHFIWSVPTTSRTHLLFRDPAGSQALQRKVLLNSSFTRQLNCLLNFPTTLEVSLENLEYFTNEGFEIHLGPNDYIWEPRYKSMTGVFLIKKMWSLLKVRTKNVM